MSGGVAVIEERLGALRERVPPALQLGTRIYFLGALLVVFAGYTQLAFGMEWTTQAGRIGAGFFPRIIGVLAILTTLVALYREFRTRAEQDSTTVTTDDTAVTERRHPMAVVYLMVAAALFAYWFLLLGAVLSGALFLGVALWFLDPEHRIRALVLGIATPVAMYLLFQTALNAGLPDGLVPMP